MCRSVGLFYGSSTGNSETIARMIYEEFQPLDIELFDIMHFKEEKLPDFCQFIFGIPTWDRSLLQEDWREFLDRIHNADFKYKKVSIYGLGDQKMYPENFVDSMGILYNWLTDRNATIVGHWKTEGYQFKQSLAVRENKFVGLALDEDQQPNLTSERVKQWVKQLKHDFDYDE